MKTQINYLSNLTPLRGMAALMVAIYHFEEIVARFVKPENSMIIRKSYLMVDLFFVMSGFIMLYVYGESFASGLKWEVFKKCIRARFARLYPLHLFVLILLVGVFYFTNQPASPINSPASIVSNLLLIHSFGIHAIFTWNVPSWSISAEWWAYMIFPVWVLLLHKNKTATIILMVVAAAVFYFSIEYFLPRTVLFAAPGTPSPHNLDVTWDYGFLRGLAGFMLGMVTFTLYQQSKLQQVFSKDFIGIISILLLLVALHIGVNDIVYIPLFLLLVLALACNQQRIHAVCNFRPLQYLGDISYSIYMIHGALIFWVVLPFIQKMGLAYRGPGSLQMSFLTGLGYCGAYLLVVVAISSLTYILIEKPCRNWINGRLSHSANKSRIPVAKLV